MNLVAYKQKLIAASRAVRMLSAADRLKLYYCIARNAPRNARFHRQYPDFRTPGYADAYDAYSHVDWNLYRDSGIEHASIIAEFIRRHKGEGPLDVLEWGCGPGRVIRHLADHLPPDSTLHGTDINPSTIKWCRKHLPGIHFATNDLCPPLSHAGESMDVILARSVFTHLSEENHFLWRTELLRVLRPGGILIATTSGDCLADVHLTAAERERYAAGELVVRSGVREGTKWYMAVHHPDFMRTRMWTGLTILEHKPGPLCRHFAQDVWVVQK